MHKILALLFLVILSVSSFSAEKVMIWVEFKDKNNSTYSISRPQEFLSPRAIERRQKQKIPIDIFDLPVSNQYLDILHADTMVSVVYTSRWFNGAMLRANSRDAINHLEGYDFITFTEIARDDNEKTTVKTATQQSGLQYQKLGLNYIDNSHPFSSISAESVFPGYGATERQISLLNGSALHDKGYWGNNVMIAVLDGGFRSVDTLKAFDNLWEGGQILGYYDFVESATQLYQGHAHGTYVLSVMGANLPEEYLGAAPAASYWLIRTEDAATESRLEEYNWLAGAEYADSVGANIINSSLGYSTFDDPAQNYTYADLDGATTVSSRAANRAFTRGMLVVNSAGNYGANEWKFIGSPADGHGVLAVGATNSQGVIATFSSYGPSSDGRVKPQVVAMGQGTAIVNYMGTVSYANGTSFSAPLISAMAACLWEKYPDATNVQIKQAIIKSADHYNSPDSLYGYGMPDFGKASAILEKQLDESDFLKLIHNPLVAESAITFYAFIQESISIEMYNSNGQKVWSKDNITVVPGYNELKPFNDISGLSAGVYLIRVNFSAKTELLKTIKL